MIEVTKEEQIFMMKTLLLLLNMIQWMLIIINVAVNAVTPVLYNETDNHLQLGSFTEEQ